MRLQPVLRASTDCPHLKLQARRTRILHQNWAMVNCHAVGKIFDWRRRIITLAPAMLCHSCRQHSVREEKPVKHRFSNRQQSLSVADTEKPYYTETRQIQEGKGESRAYRAGLKRIGTIRVSLIFRQLASVIKVQHHAPTLTYRIKANYSILQDFTPIHTGT